MSEIPDGGFLIDGIPLTSNDSLKELFKGISNKIHTYARRNSHDYVPNSLEYRASSIAYCNRKIALNKDPEQYLTKDEVEALPQWYLDERRKENLTASGPNVAGQIIHEVIQEALKSDLLGMEEEVSVEIGKFKIVGHYDLLMKLGETDKIVIDIKSTSHRRKSLPNSTHLIQLMTYQGMLGGIHGAILYVHRNDWELSFFPQQFDKDKYSKTISKISKLAYWEERKEIPPREPSFPEECKSSGFYCQFYNFCYPEDPIKLDKDQN